LFLLIDSDKHQNNLQKQETRAERFRNNKDRGSSYVLTKTCLENYYHPRAFERTYGLVAGSFPDIADNDNARTIIKEYRASNNATANIKEKNNFDVFSEMTKEEWETIVEQELVDFLREIVDTQ